MLFLKKSLAVTLVLVSTSLIANDLATNPWLAESSWPISHGDSFATDSTKVKGPSFAFQLGQPQFVSTNLLNISLPMSPKYADGANVWWGSNISSAYKLGIVNGRLKKLATISKDEEDTGGAIVNTLNSPASGGYLLVDKDNTFYTVKNTTLLAFSDGYPSSRASAIVRKQKLNLAPTFLAEEDAIIGMNMTIDGRIAFATKKAVLGVISRDFTEVSTIQLGSGSDVVSNSIATDERGGIYAVTSLAMYRVKWDGVNLSVDWRSQYNVGDGNESGGSGRLGAGSGSTPTLMGGSQDQRFVVITDGAAVANMVLFWRDEIPEDWTPIAPGKDRRIAAEMPVNFGDPKRKETFSEQSVAVSGYGALVVSNDYDGLRLIKKLGSTGNQALTSISNQIIQLLSNRQIVQPWGVQKFQWDPVARKLESAWVNMNVSCPNAIPLISSTSNRFYCVGAYQGDWTIESLDWKTGRNHFRKVLGPLVKYNSFYSQTQLTDDGGFIYGSYFGAVYVPPIKK